MLTRTGFGSHARNRSLGREQCSHRFPLDIRTKPVINLANYTYPLFVQMKNVSNLKHFGSKKPQIHL